MICGGITGSEGGRTERRLMSSVKIGLSHLSMPQAFIPCSTAVAIDWRICAVWSFSSSSRFTIIPASRNTAGHAACRTPPGRHSNRRRSLHPPIPLTRREWPRHGAARVAGPASSRLRLCRKRTSGLRQGPDFHGKQRENSRRIYRCTGERRLSISIPEDTGVVRNHGEPRERRLPCRPLPVLSVFASP